MTLPPRLKLVDSHVIKTGSLYRLQRANYAADRRIMSAASGDDGEPKVSLSY